MTKLVLPRLFAWEERAIIFFPSALTISNQVVIDGAGRSVTLTGDGNTRLFVVTASGSLTLKNVTVAYGSARSVSSMFGTPALAKGAGILNEGGSVEIDRCHFVGHYAASYSSDQPDRTELTRGGAIFNCGTLVIRSSSFERNYAVGAPQAAEGVTLRRRPIIAGS